MAEVLVRYWAGAQRAAGIETETIDVASLTELRALLGARPALARIAEVSSFLIDGQQAGETAGLHEGAEVDVLPPFAGADAEAVPDCRAP